MDHSKWAELSGADIKDHAFGPERVADTLRQAIADRMVVPGEKLPEVQIAQILGVSRHTLRSAFQVLAGEGLVERMPNRGVFVHSPTAEDVREIYRTRRIVEVGALRAAEVPEPEIDRMQQIVTAALQARDRGDLLAVAEGNQRFHGSIVALSHNTMLITLMDQVLARMRLLFHFLDEDPSYHTYYVDRHQGLVDLLESGERSAAESDLLEYLGRAESQLLGHLEPAPVGAV